MTSLTTFSKAWSFMFDQTPNISPYQFVIFNSLSYCFEGTIGFDVKASFASRPESRLIGWYNEPGDITKEF